MNVTSKTQKSLHQSSEDNETKRKPVQKRVTVTKLAKKPRHQEPVYKPIYYLKMHKTGSTTVAMELKRYARRHGQRLRRLDPSKYVHVKNTHKAKADVFVNYHSVFNNQ